MVAKQEIALGTAVLLTSVKAYWQTAGTHVCGTSQHAISGISGVAAAFSLASNCYMGANCLGIAKKVSLPFLLCLKAAASKHFSELDCNVLAHGSAAACQLQCMPWRQDFSRQECTWSGAFLAADRAC